MKHLNKHREFKGSQTINTLMQFCWIFSSSWHESPSWTFDLILVSFGISDLTLEALIFWRILYLRFSASSVRIVPLTGIFVRILYFYFTLQTSTNHLQMTFSNFDVFFLVWEKKRIEISQVRNLICVNDIFLQFINKAIYFHGLLN